MPTDLAKYVFQRSQRSIFLLEGLRLAFTALDHPEFIAVLNLVVEDATQARDAAQMTLERAKHQGTLRALSDLRKLSRKGGHRAHRLAVRVAVHIAPPTEEAS